MSAGQSSLVTFLTGARLDVFDGLHLLDIRVHEVMSSTDESENLRALQHVIANRLHSESFAQIFQLSSSPGDEVATHLFQLQG